MGKFWNRSRWNWFYRFSFMVVIWCYANLLTIAIIAIIVTLLLWAGYSCWSQAWAVVASLAWWLWAVLLLHQWQGCLVKLWAWAFIGNAGTERPLHQYLWISKLISFVLYIHCFLLVDNNICTFPFLHFIRPVWRRGMYSDPPLLCWIVKVTE